MDKIYLDNAATTKPNQEVIDYVVGLLKNNWANPSSVYDVGLESRRIIEKSRQIIANKINAEPEEIIFTTSASSSNNLAIQGYINANRCYNWITSNIEHSSVLNIEFTNELIRKYIYKCDKYGFMNPETFSKCSGCLVSVQGVNNEIGTIQPLKDIADIVHKNNNVFHSDLTQWIPHIPVDVKSLGLDMASFASHKINGLKGCGVLYVKDGIKLSPLVYGSQEQGLYGGTEDIYSIAAMGKAMELLDYTNEKNIEIKRGYLLNKLLYIPGVTLNGSLKNRLVNNLNICIHDIKIDNQQLIALMDMKGYCLSAGSACHSGEKSPSKVLQAIGMTDNDINRSIRITISNENTYEELDKFIIDLNNTINQFR